MTRVRVLVAEDSATVREHLCAILRSDPGIEVVGAASHGAEAIRLCAELRPDVVTLDMMMPHVTGLEATEHIMAHTPTPILIVSSSTNRGELFRTYEALAAGAVDVLEKPTGEEGDGWERKFLAAVKLVARVRVITHLRGRLAPARRAPAATQAAADDVEPASAPRPRSIVAIGASTGGPGAIVDVLSALPTPFSTPVLVVLHIGHPFGLAFAEWLDDQLRHPVRFAVGGERLRELAGSILLAPPDMHLVVRGNRLALSNEAERHSCRPSVDVLFESLARELGSSAVACLLTGMGRDGAAGLLALRRSGALTIAQDEATSVVYGMPREAALLGAADRVLPLSAIGPAIASAIGGGGGS